MPTESIRIPLENERSMEGLLDLPERADARRTAVIMAHGAANDMQEPLLRHLAAGLRRAGFAVLRFNFPYRSEGRKNPDSQGVLEAAGRQQAVYDLILECTRDWLDALPA